MAGPVGSVMRFTSSIETCLGHFVLFVMMFGMVLGTSAFSEPTKSSDPLTGVQLKAFVEGLAQEKQLHVEALLSEKRTFYPCEQDLVGEPVSPNWRAVQVRCPGDKGWDVVIRTSGLLSPQEESASPSAPIGNMGTNPQETYPAVVYAKPLVRGTVLSSADVETAMLPQVQTIGVMTQIEQVIGRTLLRNVVAGVGVAATHLEPRYIFRPGDVVRVINNQSRIVIETEAIVLEPAQLGETFLVQNRTSGVKLRVKALGGKKVQLIAKLDK